MGGPWDDILKHASLVHEFLYEGQASIFQAKKRIKIEHLKCLLRLDDDVILRLCL